MFEGKLSHLSSETKCCGGCCHPAGSFSALRAGHGSTWENRIHKRMNELQKYVTTILYNRECTLVFSHSMYTIKVTTETVLYTPTTTFFTRFYSKRDHTNSTKYGMTRWHPQASQWPKVAYHGRRSLKGWSDHLHPLWSMMKRSSGGGDSETQGLQCPASLSSVVERLSHHRG